MRRTMRNVLAAFTLAGAATTASFAQKVSAPNQPPLELALTYIAGYSNPVNGSDFWRQGGGVQIHGRFYGGWGVVADIAGTHVGDIHSTGVGLDLVTATFGPRYTWLPEHSRYSLYGQGLVGQAWGLNSVFPNSSGITTNADSLAVKAGGGLNVALTPHFSLRAVELDYLRTQLPNSSSNTQNNFILGAGVILKF